MLLVEACGDVDGDGDGGGVVVVEGEEEEEEEEEGGLAIRPMRHSSSSSMTVCGRISWMVLRTRMALALLICAVPIK